VIKEARKPRNQEGQRGAVKRCVAGGGGGGGGGKGNKTNGVKNDQLRTGADEENPTV